MKLFGGVLKQNNITTSKNLKIALFGHGKMGKLIENLAHTKGFEVPAIFTSKDEDFNALKNVDVCIDFSNGNAVLENVKKAASYGKNIVIGSTGWQEYAPEIKKIVEKHQIGALYSPNFSIGVLLFYKIVEEAAKLISKTNEYDVAGVEIHHNQKKDAPSGTALALKEAVLKSFQKNFDFSSVRVGQVPGTHTLIFDSLADQITLTHTAKSRQGFAEGALKSALWLIGKKGFYQLEDIL